MNMSNIHEIKETIRTMQNEHPKYNFWVQVEYQLDLNRAVLQISAPYDNYKESEYELQLLGIVKAEEVYQTINSIAELGVSFEIIDMTEGNFYHNESLIITLKQYAKNFINIGTQWRIKEHEHEN